MRMIITEYSKCDCGAITLYTDEGNYNCKQKNLKKFFPDIDLIKIPRLQTTYCCNHCVNGYGLDLCGCGSGEDFGKCDGEFDECNQPMQKLGEYTKVIAKDAWI